jgi:predicted GIY-YIG superfamily endonuclease
VWFVYILHCADDSFYVGETHDIAERLAAHNKGCASTHTATRRPVTLAYAEQHASRTHALHSEQQLKRWSRAKKKALIANDVAALKRL